MATNGVKVQIGVQDELGQPSSNYVEATASEKERHDSDAKVTMNPRESQSEVADHIYTLPDKVSLSLIFTHQNVQTFVNGADGTPRDLEVSDQAKLSPDDVYNRLRDYRVQNNLLFLVTATRVYSNMAITKIGLQKDVKTANILKINLTLVQLETVEALREESTISIRPPKKDKKKKEAEELAEAEKKKKKDKTVLFSAAENTGVSEALDDIRKKAEEAFKYTGN